MNRINRVHFRVILSDDSQSFLPLYTADFSSETAILEKRLSSFFFRTDFSFRGFLLFLKGGFRRHLKFPSYLFRVNVIPVHLQAMILDPRTIFDVTIPNRLFFLTLFFVCFRFPRQMLLHQEFSEGRFSSNFSTRRAVSATKSPLGSIKSSSGNLVGLEAYSPSRNGFFSFPYQSWGFGKPLLIPYESHLFSTPRVCDFQPSPS